MTGRVFGHGVRYKDAPQLGRFVLRDEGVTVGVGIVTELFES